MKDIFEIKKVSVEHAFKRANDVLGDFHVLLRDDVNKIYRFKKRYLHESAIFFRDNNFDGILTRKSFFNIKHFMNDDYTRNTFLDDKITVHKYVGTINYEDNIYNVELTQRFNPAFNNSKYYAKVERY